MSLFNIWNPVKVCRTRMISKDFFQCKVKRFDSKFCEYSLSMGDGYICNHLDRLGFSNQK